MATISKEMATKIAENKGRYSDDPPVHVVFEFVNSFNHEVCYGTCYDRSEFIAYFSMHAVTRILWAADDFDALLWLSVNGNFH